MPTPIDPSADYVVHTASDTVPIKYNGVPKRCRGISVGTSGDVSAKNYLGDTVVIPSLAAGVIHPISTDYVFATSTTATGIVVYF